jgi:SAM-dependent methyltransferase
MHGKISKKIQRLKVWLRSLAAVRIRDEKFGDLGTYCAAYARTADRSSPTHTLDIGCGEQPRNPFRADKLFGIDIREDPARDIKYADLAIEPIPYPSECFDYVTAYDFIEHVPRILYLPARRFPFIELMNEIHRVLKPGGVLLSHTPAYPYAPVFRDPTHVNIISEETFPMYFDDKNVLARMYGFTGAFTVVKQGWRKPHLITVLKKAEVAR